MPRTVQVIDAEINALRDESEAELRAIEDRHFTARAG
jgi:hypothetical protein